MKFAENKKLKQASYHFYSHFGTNYFDVPLPILSFRSYYYFPYFQGYKKMYKNEM